MAVILLFPGDNKQPAEYRTQTCLLCGYEFTEDTRGFSEFACEDHGKCEGQHGACAESVHPHAEGNYCAGCNLENEMEYLKDVLMSAPSPMTNEAWRKQQEAYESVAEAEGLLASVRAFPQRSVA